jgi:UDP-N-acetyl-D-galactosamine dehydrogenase
MSLYQRILSRQEKIAVIGLGYVGMPLAVAFAKKADVIGFDVSEDKIRLYKSGIDPTREVGDAAILQCGVEFTADEARLRDAMLHIIAVPTPVNEDKIPDLSLVESASRTVGRNLKPGSIVVYESTVFPGVTENICIPILEKESGLRCGKDFKAGYSPERINPGDKINTLETIVKIVSGVDDETLRELSDIYELIIKAGVYRAPTIKAAEAAKVVENSQRDINIAFMNELAMIFDKMGIDTNDVVDAMNTKWNALGFRPGLVGGHCISVDPYYFIYEAQKLGYHSQIILSGRKVNEGMAAYITDAVIKQLILTGKPVKSARIAVMGVTFKENCPDIRNSKVIDIIERLREYEIRASVADPLVDAGELEREYGISLSPPESFRDMDCCIFAVSHDRYKRLTWDEVDSMYSGNGRVLIDIKGIFNAEEAEARGYSYWRL